MDYRPVDDLSEKEINDLVYLNSSVIPGIESVMRMAGIYINAFTHEKLLDWLTINQYSPDEITNAIKIMASNGKCSMAYAEGIMKNARNDRERRTANYKPLESRENTGCVQSQQKEDGRKPFSKYVC